MKLLLTILFFNLWCLHSVLANTCSHVLKKTDYESDLRAAMVVTNNADQTFDLQTRILKQATDLELIQVRTFLGEEEGLLSPFFVGGDLKSSLKSEDRFVLPGEKSWDFLEASKDLNWKELGEHTTKPNQVRSTLTAYAGRFILNDKDGGQAIVKVRFRKHYTHQRGQTRADKMTAVEESWTHLELKISGDLEKTESLGFLNSSFKPSILIKNTVAQKLQKMKKAQFSDPDFKEEIIGEILNFPNPDGEMPNEAQVRAMIEALFMMGEVNHKLFRLETVVSYDRSIFEAEVDGENFRYTVDQNIRIYEPRSNISITNLQAYFDRNAEYKAPEDVNFVELKAPSSFRDSYNPRYLGLTTYLGMNHLSTFVRGSGKFTLSKTIRNHYGQNSMSSKLVTEGLLFFLIKGTANLPTPPNRKKLVEQSTLDVAIPVTKQGKTHRLILHYRPLISNGERSEILDSISMVDHLGRDVSISNSFVKELVNAALAGPDPISVSLNDEVILIPGVIPPEVTAEYNDFFSRFYTNYSKKEGNPREIESLQPIETLKQLKRYITGLNVVNAMSYGWSRMHRVVMQVAITGVLIGGWTYFYLGDSGTRELVTETTDNAIEMMASRETDIIIDSKGSILTFNSSNGSASVFVLLDPNGNLMSLPVNNVSEDDEVQNINVHENGTMLTLYGATGSSEVLVLIDDEGLLTFEEVVKAPEEEDDDNDRD